MLTDPPEYYPNAMRHILDMVSSAVLVLEADSHIVFANQRASVLFGYPVKELKQCRLEQLFMPDDTEIMVPNILKITMDSLEYKGEAMLRKRDDTSFMGLVCSSFLAWEGGRGVVVTIHDITHMKDLERVLKFTGRVAFLGHLLDDISHQIRNPVQVIGGIAKRLAESLTLKAEHIQAIVTESERLEKLLDTLHFFIKLPRPNLRPVKLQQVIEIVEPQLRATARDFGVDWSLEASASLLKQSVFIDLQLLTKALHEGVVNACESYDTKHNDQTISFRVLTTDREEQPFAIEITDRGAGIAAKELPYVFSPFFSRKTKHMGMGLTIAQRILEEMDGDLVLDSVDGTGSVLTYYLIKERRRTIRLRKIE